MRILVFSDTHLTDKFDHKKFIFLKSIISNVDMVIINGDFWDGWKTTFSQFLTSPWNKLFPLLKRKKAVYIFGNHDKASFCNKKTSLFSILQTDKYTFSIGKKTFIVEHGNRFNLSYKKFAYTKLGLKVTHHRLAGFIFEFFEKMIIKTLGRKVLYKINHKFNEEIKKQIKKILSVNEVLICGHTHSPELDLTNKYINVGSIRYGFGQFIIISEKNILLKDINYDNNEIINM